VRQEPKRRISPDTFLRFVLVHSYMSIVLTLLKLEIHISFFVTQCAEKKLYLNYQKAFQFQLTPEVFL